MVILTSTIIVLVFGYFIMGALIRLGMAVMGALATLSLYILAVIGAVTLFGVVSLPIIAVAIGFIASIIVIKSFFRLVFNVAL